MGRLEDSPFNEDFEIFHEAQQYNSLLEVVCFAQDTFDRHYTPNQRRGSQGHVRSETLPFALLRIIS
jgi:hypothetical protein